MIEEKDEGKLLKGKGDWKRKRSISKEKHISQSQKNMLKMEIYFLLNQWMEQQYL